MLLLQAFAAVTLGLAGAATTSINGGDLNDAAQDMQQQTIHAHLTSDSSSIFIIKQSNTLSHYLKYHHSHMCQATISFRTMVMMNLQSWDLYLTN